MNTQNCKPKENENDGRTIPIAWFDDEMFGMQLEKRQVGERLLMWKSGSAGLTGPLTVDGSSVSWTGSLNFAMDK